MKKFFLFAAAIVAAMTVNAKVIDLTAVATSIDDWTPGAQATLNTNASDESKNKYVYDIAGGEDPNETVINNEASLVFQTKNTSKKEKAFVIYPGKCFEFGGKNGILIIKNTQPGAAIKLTVAAKGGTASNFDDANQVYPKNAAFMSAELTLPAKGSEGGDEEGYVWKVLELTSLGGDVEIKEFAGGYRITRIEIGGETAVENVNADVKSVKTIENGQLVIIKNGVKYNALGTEIR